MHATCCLQHGWLLTCANLGDSRAIVDTGREVTVLTDDHRVATHRLERRRLERKGATIAPVDINGGQSLAVVISLLHSFHLHQHSHHGHVKSAQIRLRCVNSVPESDYSLRQAGAQHRVRVQSAWDPCGYGPAACASPGRLATLTWGSLCCRCHTSPRSSTFLWQQLHCTVLKITATVIGDVSRQRPLLTAADMHGLQVRVPSEGARLLVASDGVWDAFEKTSRVASIARSAVTQVIRRAIPARAERRQEALPDRFCHQTAASTFDRHI